MEITGERYIPELDWPEISYEHWHRYLWARRFVKNKRVLDVGCGEGYGSIVLAQQAAKVVAIDADREVIDRLAVKNSIANLEFRHGLAQQLPVDETERFDLVVSFEMLEHLNAEDQHHFLAEVQRVLAQDGVFIVSTPDKQQYSDVTNYQNEFHLHELYTHEFKELLESAFSHVYLLGQRVFPTSHIWPLEGNASEVYEEQLHYEDGRFVPGQADQKQAIFILAICANHALEPEPISLLLDTSNRTSIRTKHALEDQEQTLLDQHVRLVQLEHQLLKDANDIQHLQELVVVRDQQLSKDAEDIAKLQSMVLERDQQLSKDAEDIAKLQAMVLERDQQLRKDAEDIAMLQAMVLERDQQLRKDAEDIAMLQAMVLERDQQLRKDAEDIAKLQSMILEREAQVVREQLALQNRDIYIQELEQQLRKDAEDIAMLQGMVVERDMLLARNKRQLAFIREQLSFVPSPVLASMKTGIRSLRQVKRVTKRTLDLGRKSTAMLRKSGLKATLQHSRNWIQQRRNSALFVQEPAPTAIEAPTASEIDPSTNYAAWLALHRVEIQNRFQTGSLQSLEAHVDIVVLLPSSDMRLLEQTVASLQAQIVQSWQAWLVLQETPSSDQQAALNSLLASDARLHLVEAHGTELLASLNGLIEQLAGEFVIFLQTGDLLEKEALSALLLTHAEQPQVDLIYSDSDRIESDGSYCDPFFVPDWSPALLLSVNYLRGLSAVRRERLQSLGGLDPASGTAWLWDLALRLGEQRACFVHLPYVLHHRYAYDPTQECLSPDAQAVVSRHMQRRGIDAQAAQNGESLQLSWPLASQPLVSIIIPSRNLEMVARCIETIDTHTAYRNFEIIVADTSADGSIEQHYAQASGLDVRVLRYTKPFNYSEVNNIVAQQARGEVLLFLNDDIEAFEEGWLEELLRWALLDEIGVVGAQLLRADRSLQHAGVVIGLQGFAGHPFDGLQPNKPSIFGQANWYRNYTAVTGACMMIRRELFHTLGGFDEQMVLCGSDVEICIRAIKHGYQVIYTPFARLFHLESATRGASAIPVMDFAYSYVYYLPYLRRGDPYYNRNLSVWSNTPRLSSKTEVTSLDHAQASLHQLGVMKQAEELEQRLTGGE
jgi:Predicted glycosyltransferases